MQSAGPVNPLDECKSDIDDIMQDVKSAETETNITQDDESTKKITSKFAQNSNA